LINREDQEFLWWNRGLHLLDMGMVADDRFGLIGHRSLERAEAWYEITIDTIYFTETLWQFKILEPPRGCSVSKTLALG
jgi:hypothetical protein